MKRAILNGSGRSSKFKVTVVCKTLFVFLILLPVTIEAGEFQAVVVSVTDGDTVKVRRISDNKQIKVRIFGIDAPEYRQKFAEVSTRFLRSQIGGKKVLICPRSRDRYGRTVAEIKSGNRSIGLLMISNGLAWHSSKYCKSNLYAEAEKSAWNGKKGIWKEKNQIPPWEFRKKKIKI